jgi:hypothetical protein
MHASGHGQITRKIKMHLNNRLLNKPARVKIKRVPVSVYIPLSHRKEAAYYAYAALNAEPETQVILLELMMLED